MRKITVLSFITLDGVMQAPGGPQEDTSGGFEYGGWTAPYNEKASGEFMQKQLEPADLLLGRKTFEIFASYWPEHADIWPGINEVTKYTLSNTIEKSDWNNSVILKNIAEIKSLKNSDGADLKVWGSSKLVQLLLKNDLVDEFWLNIHPIILGKGKKMFDDAAMPASFILQENFVTPRGVVMAHYIKTGKVETGTVAEK